MTASPASLPPWRRCTPTDAALLAELNAQLSEDEGAAPVGTPAAYLERMRTWLEDGPYDAALAEEDGRPLAYVLWRHDPEYADVYVRQFFVVRSRRGEGLGGALFERAVAELWPDQPLRLDVYDSNPAGRAFWERMGFTAYSSLMRRVPSTPSVS